MAKEPNTTIPITIIGETVTIIESYIIVVKMLSTTIPIAITENTIIMVKKKSTTISISIIEENSISKRPVTIITT